MEALPPNPPAEVAFHGEPTPDLAAPIVIDSSTLPSPAEAPQPTALDTLPPVSEGQVSSEPSRLQRLKGTKVGKVVMGEGVGTVLDMATIAAGIPLPVRETAGSAVDSVVYGTKGAEVAQNPSRTQKIAKRVGSVAMFAVTGIAAQKFGSEAADLVYDKLNRGVTGEYVTPLASKMPAIPIVNAAINRIGR